MQFRHSFPLTGFKFVLRTVLQNYGTKGFKFKDAVLMARNIKEDVENEIQQIFTIYDSTLMPCVSGICTES
jgi:hypothetical protein